MSDVKIKDKRTGCKILKFMLKTYAFVYQRLMDFPRGKFDYETLTTTTLFQNIHKIINVKIRLHHSRVTGNFLVLINFLVLLTIFLVLTCFFFLEELDFQFGR